jgi:uncharacterized protein (TIGR03083 family)
VELSQYLVSLARDGAAFGDLIESHRGEAVPSCPGWTVADLAHHLGSAFHFWHNIVEHRHGSPERVGEPERPSDERLAGWYRRELADLERVLAQADPDATHWTWSVQRNTAFVIRRMAQETAIHLWDLRSALGEAPELPLELADDGIEEFLTHFATERRKDAPSVNGRIEFVVFETGRACRSAGMGDVDAIVSGPASDLLLVLWRRLPLDAVEIEGDRAIVERFLSGIALY